MIFFKQIYYSRIDHRDFIDMLGYLVIITYFNKKRDNEHISNSSSCIARL